MTYYEQSGVTIEPIDICRHYSFIVGNIIKYICRYQYKGNPLSDLIKARDYLLMQQRFGYTAAPPLPDDVLPKFQMLRKKHLLLNCYTELDGKITPITIKCLQEALNRAIADTVAQLLEEGKLEVKA